MDEKKKSKGPAVGMLMTSFGARILIPLTEEEEERQQLQETLQLNTIEKRAPPVPYLENVGPFRLEQQRKVLEKVA